MGNATWFLFLSDLFHQILFYIGGVLALVELFMTKWLNTPLEKRLFNILVIGCLFIACFQSWVDEHHNVEELIKDKAHVSGEREYWRGQSDAKDQSVRENVTALSQTQRAFADLSNKVLDITRPEPLRILVKTNRLSPLDSASKKISLLSIVSNKPLSPVRGVLSCEHPFQKLGGTSITGETITQASGDISTVNDHEVRIGVVSPALNPDTPMLVLALTAAEPGVGKCTFTRD
jgi:hypothetical protein